MPIAIIDEFSSIKGKQKRLYARQIKVRRESGLCVQCGGTIEKERKALKRTRCQACSNLHKEWRKKRLGSPKPYGKLKKKEKVK